jgi:endonuclease YncB( thermonuclease family)
MIENGWAAFFPIYPSLPQNRDMNKAISSTEDAWNNKRGIWNKYGEYYWDMNTVCA